MEALFQLLLQVYICFVHYFQIRRITLMQELSIVSSFFFIVYRMTNFFMPQILRRNPQEHIWTIIQRAMWPFILNSLIVYNFIAYMNTSSLTDMYERMLHKTIHTGFIITFPILVFFVCSCIQVFISYKSKSLKQSRMVKLICIMFCIGMLLFVSLYAYFIYLSIISYSFQDWSHYVVVIYLSIFAFCDLLVACVCARAVFSIKNLSEIWNLDKVFVMDMNWHGNVAIFFFAILTIVQISVPLFSFQPKT